MSAVTTPPSGNPPSFPMRRFTVDEYHRMIQAGIFTENDPVELLEGWIIAKMPHNPPHDGTIQLVDESLRTRLPPGWRIRVQSAITLDDSEPEPDLALVSGGARTWITRHPGPGDIAVVIEVADSSLSHDRNDKARVYARANIVCYWIVNLVDRRIEVYTDPSGPGAMPTYRQSQDYGVNDSVPLVIGGQQVVQVGVRDLLP